MKWMLLLIATLIYFFIGAGVAFRLEASVPKLESHRFAVIVMWPCMIGYLLGGAVIAAVPPAK